MLLSEILKDEMSKRNLSIQDIAECSGLSYNKVRSYTLGTIPKKNDLEIICDAIGINPDTLVFDELNISVDEAAKMMGKSPNFVKMMVRKGVFGFYNGSSYHIPRFKFEEYMGLRNSYQIDNVVDAMFQILKERFKNEKADFSQKSTSTN